MELLEHVQRCFALGLALIAGCHADRSRECTSPSDCLHTVNAMGVCVSSPESSSSWCAYDASDCPLRMRWGPLAGDGLAETCVDMTEGPVWSLVGGGMRDDVVSAVDIDAQGWKVALAGSFSGTLELRGCEAIVSLGPNPDIFVAGVNARGECEWIERYGSDGTEDVVAVHWGMGIIVAGNFDDAIIFGDSNLLSNGGSDVFIATIAGPAEFTDSGRSIGGLGNEYVTGMEQYGNAQIIVGYFDGDVDFGTGTPASTHGSNDIFVAGYDAGSAWVRTFGDTGDDRASAMAVDGDGKLIVTGQFMGLVNFGSAIHQAAGGSTDAFVLKLDSDGMDEWALRFGGPGYEVGRTVTTDSSRGVVVGGVFDSATDFGDGVFVTPSWSDGFVVKLAPSGGYEWSVKLGGNEMDEVRSVSAGASSIFAAGTFADSVSFGGDPLSSRGAEDVFVVKLALQSGAYEDSKHLGGVGSDDVKGIAAAETGHLAVCGSFQDTVQLAGGDPAVSAGMSDLFGVLYTP